MFVGRVQYFCVRDVEGLWRHVGIRLQPRADHMSPNPRQFPVVALEKGIYEG